MINQIKLTSGKRPVRIIQNLPIRKRGPKNGKGIFTMDERLQKILRIPAQELGKGSPVQLRVVDTDKDMCYDIALNILKEVADNNRQGRHTVFIWPVGPVGQYPILAELINRYRVSFKNVHVFQMDEYLNDDLTPIPESSPLSFTGFLHRFIESLDEELRIPESQHYIPTVGKEDFNWKRIQELGGVDTAYGGIGITGHIAFNEPPLPDDAITDAEFRDLPTRVLKILPETRTINAYTAARGAIDLIPEWCITIGMREILSARKIRFYMNREWQSGVVRKLLHGEVTRFVPSSFFQTHPDARLTITKEVAAPPLGHLR